MKIKIEFVGFLNIKSVKNNTWINVENSLSISQLLINHGIPKLNQKFIFATISKISQPLTYILQDKDELFLYLPVGGG